MNGLFLFLTILFIIVASAMILIILVQRPQGGGLAGAFGGAGGGGTESLFGGRVGDALTWATVIAFTVYLGLAISLNKVPTAGAVAQTTDAGLTAPPTGDEAVPPAPGAPAEGAESPIGIPGVKGFKKVEDPPDTLEQALPSEQKPAGSGGSE